MSYNIQQREDETGDHNYSVPVPQDRKDFDAIRKSWISWEYHGRTCTGGVSGEEDSETLTYNG